MKKHFLLSLVLFSALCFSSFASNIDLKMKNVTLEEAITALHRASNYTIVLNSDQVDLSRIVSVNASKASIDDVMTQLLAGQNLTFTVNGNKIVISSAPEETKYATRGNEDPQLMVSGKVTDRMGEPLMGAGVLVKGNASRGCITDGDGAYSLSVNKGDVLVFNFLGFVDKEVEISKAGTLNVVLEESQDYLDEVVVVGYGTQRKRDVTTAIASLKSSDMSVPVSSLSQAMIGKMAGVTVQQPNGIPGGGISVKVRGTGTISAGTEPLYVIDGFPMSDGASNGPGMKVNPLSSISMNDIESIEVLKDASAAAIYGSRGANGVVIITTKKGQEGKLSVQYDGYIGAQNVTKKIDMLNAYEHAELCAEARNTTYLQTLASKGKTGSITDTNDERRVKLGGKGDRLNYIIPDYIQPYLDGKPGLTDTDWQDEIFRTALIHSHNLSITGGNKDTHYFVSMNYRKEDGVVICTDFEQMGGRANVETRYKKFGIGSNISFNHSNYSLVPSEDKYGNEAVISTALGMLPSQAVYNEDGSFNYNQVILNHGLPNLINPVALATLRDDKMQRNRVIGNVFADYEIIDGLVFKTTLGVDLNSYRRDIYRPSTLPTTSNTAVITNSNPTATNRTKDILDFVWENTLSYDKIFNNDHRVSAVTGWTVQKETISGNKISATDFPNDLIHTLNGAPITGITDFSSTIEEWSLLSWLMRGQYSFKDKYLVSAAIRMDGSSRFGKNNRWGTFPSLSAGWYISEEDFMQNAKDWLSKLKLRASWGKTGNFSIGNYEYYPTLSGDDYVFGKTETLNTGLYPGNAGNADLGWEKTSMVNLGIESSFFNIVDVELDLYKSLTTDMLLTVPVPEISGYSEVLKNCGKMSNKGLEITVFTHKTWGKFSWNNKLNFAKNINEVIDLGGAQEMRLTSNNVEFITQVGKPIGNYFGYVTDGVFLNQEEIDLSKKKDPETGIAFVSKAEPGDFKFVDQNKDGVINSEDKTIIGNYMPDFTYGYSAEFAYANVDLSISMQGVYGNEIANINRRYINNMEGGSCMTDALDRWHSESNPGSGLVVRANRSATGMNGQTSTWHIEDASYLRITNMTLGYTFSQKFANKLHLASARMYVSSQNPFTFTKYSGYNPEVDKEGNPLTPGIDYGTYPLAKSFVFGLNLKF